MRYAHILTALRTTPWAALPSTVQTVADLVTARIRVGSSLADDRARVSRFAPAADFHDPDSPEGVPDSAPSSFTLHPSTLPFTVPAPGVALVEVRGILGKRLNMMDTECGGCDIETVVAALEAAAVAPGIAHIVLHLDTPGGVVTGIPEATARIRELAAIRPIYAFTDTLCASAGYWLASACTGILATPSAQLGSIGVYMALVDQSAAFTSEGLRLVLVKAGEWKAAGEPGSVITPEQEGLWQGQVDALYAMFTTDVRRGRPGVADEALQGQSFLGASAVSALLADQLVTGLDEVLASLALARAASP